MGKMPEIDAAIFLICCLGAEKHDGLSRREYARFVLEKYLNYPVEQLTDEQKMARFEQAIADGKEVVGKRKVWVVEEKPTK